MSEKFNIADIYDKNLNFLIGSGASYGMFPTLRLNVKGLDGSIQTIEKLATIFDKSDEKEKLALLFMYYYIECIEPVLAFDPLASRSDSIKLRVLENYEKFLRTILLILRKKKSNDLKVCNLFTTNYDGCISHVADEIIKSGNEEFVLNDGSRGFFRRYLSAKNYSSQVSQSGVFDKYSTQVPQINLIHIHGSAYWKRDADQIQVDYGAASNQLIERARLPDISKFSVVLKNGDKNISEIQNIGLTQKQRDDFWEKYVLLPIVNPTKWKFHETVFEEHYYQMLRHLSYELERPNSVLVTFGFSFADEHILNLIKRSLGNPTLQVFVSCFDEAERKSLGETFVTFKNISFLTGSGLDLDFSKFNDDLFALKESGK